MQALAREALLSAKNIWFYRSAGVFNIVFAEPYAVGIAENCEAFRVYSVRIEEWVESARSECF